ncbi:MAG: MaoC family dehydratase [Chloroflexi bacterium]|nr:MaoC family dehydratase [Chloroflexota bacterium]
MLDQQEKLWDYNAVEPGQAGQPTVVAITAENIAEYARLSQNPQYSNASIAMPTMILSYAPLRREDIAQNNGFVALEESKTARRQTPFAKCEVRFFHPVQAGDTITGNRRVLEKYERRGSKFVTFRIEASNQRGEKVAEYDYTCIFDYAKGQREVPKEPAPNQPSPTPASTPSQIIRFETAGIGDRLGTLTITESQEIINRKNDFRLAGAPSVSNIHTDEEFARQNIFGGTVNAGPATMSYVDQMLEQSFPLSAFYNGGSLLMRAITPFRSGDTVTFEGEITDKREDEGKQILDCRVKGNNQRGELVCLADATMVMAG